MNYELDIIEKMGYLDYFLIVEDYVKFAKDNKIPVGPGRGSSAGSLISYLLNITEIDSIKYNLLFERFLNPERTSMPDIDIDFADYRRDEIINYINQKYGQNKTSLIITFQTMKAKQALRDIGRVFSYNNNDINTLSKAINKYDSFKDAYKYNEDFRLLMKDDYFLEIIKLAKKIEDLPRQSGIHAAGIIINDEDLEKVIPIHKNNNNLNITHFEAPLLEELGFLKMDILSLSNLTLIENMINYIHTYYDPSFDIKKISFNDKKTFDILNLGFTSNIFQLDSQGITKALKEVIINNFDDLVALLALYRPGPMDNIPIYANNKNKHLKINYIHPLLEPILKPTYGVIIYQEQIMEIVKTCASFSLGKADLFRRAMSKKKEEILLKEKDKFINGSIKRGYSEELARKNYDLILKFAAYGFNKAHSVSYATISYRMAYLKAHYKEDFMKTLLNFELNSVNKTKEYIYECKKEGLNILKPDINKSDKYYLKEKDGIRYPLTGLKNLGSMIVNNILDERKNGDFKSIYDFIKRTNRKNINKKTLISLIDAGCFDSFDLNHRTMIDGIDLIINYGELIKDLDEEFVLLPELEIKEEYSKHELLKRELDVIGLYISDNPITEYKQKLNNKFNICDVSHWFDKNVNIIGTIDYVKEVETKKQDKMCFIKISDELASIDGVVFPQLYKTLNEIKKDKTVLISGKVEKRFDKYQIIVNNIKYLNLN
ncbi:MAG: DNA polymerase III subunit alpha [Bacilli bacterium]